MLVTNFEPFQEFLIRNFIIFLSNFKIGTYYYMIYEKLKNFAGKTKGHFFTGKAKDPNFWFIGKF
jgi:hypothetical protein